MLFTAINHAEKIPPIDEAEKYKDFYDFRKDLIKAVHNKDKKFLLQHISQDIKTSFGIADGKEAFIYYWELHENSENSKFWDEFTQVLELGGSFIQDIGAPYFIAPYVFTQFPEKYDVYQHALITGNKVHLRDKPSLNSNIVMDLSYEIVFLYPLKANTLVQQTIDNESHYWYKIKTLHNKTGYIYGKYIRQAIDYRAIFEKVNNQWLLTGFLAGD